MVQERPKFSDDRCARLATDSAGRRVGGSAGIVRHRWLNLVSVDGPTGPERWLKPRPPITTSGRDVQEFHDDLDKATCDRCGGGVVAWCDRLAGISAIAQVAIAVAGQCGAGSRRDDWRCELQAMEPRIDADDVAVAGLPSAGTAELLRVARIHADLSIATLFKRAPVVEALEIDSPFLRIARTGDGHYDVDDLITRFTPRADAPALAPARFALYNLQVRNAQFRFDDQPARRVHMVEALQIALPFVSNLPAEVEVKVEPRLAFKLNGTPFDSGAQATPFAQNKSGALNLKMADLDLAPTSATSPQTCRCA